MCSARPHAARCQWCSGKGSGNSSRSGLLARDWKPEGIRRRKLQINAQCHQQGCTCTGRQCSHHVSKASNSSQDVNAARSGNARQKTRQCTARKTAENDTARHTSRGSNASPQAAKPNVSTPNRHVATDLPVLRAVCTTRISAETHFARNGF